MDAPSQHSIRWVPKIAACLPDAALLPPPSVPVCSGPGAIVRADAGIGANAAVPTLNGPVPTGARAALAGESARELRERRRRRPPAAAAAPPAAAKPDLDRLLLLPPLLTLLLRPLLLRLLMLLLRLLLLLLLLLKLLLLRPLMARRALASR